jgi:hypothetical protein
MSKGVREHFKLKYEGVEGGVVQWASARLPVRVVGYGQGGAGVARRQAAAAALRQLVRTTKQGMRERGEGERRGREVASRGNEGDVVK